MAKNERHKTGTMGRVICEARERAGLSQEFVAKHLGVSRAAVAQWEANYTNPRGTRLKKLADLLGLSPNEMHEFNGPDGVRNVPLIPSVSAGPWVEVDAIDTLTDYPTVPVVGLGRGVFVACRVEGESMNRIAPPGSLVIVDIEDRALEDRGVYILAGRNGATLKRFRSMPDRLVAETTAPGHDDIFPSGPIYALGRVKMVISTP